MHRVLIVDDEHHIRSGLADKIEQMEDGFAVAGEAGDGAEALSWLKDRHADICLIDIRMPVMDGLELIGRIRGMYPRTACIVVSSHDEFAYAKTAFAGGANDYLLKPVDRTELKEALDRARDTIRRRGADEANRLLLGRREPSEPLLERWKDVVVTAGRERYAPLVVDTLTELERWIGDDIALLEPLASAWVEMARAAVRGAERDALPEPIPGPSDSQASLDRGELRRHYRFRAVARLEIGLLAMIDAAREGARGDNARIVHAVQKYIQQHYAEKLNVEELADRIPISRSYLAVLFKTGTGRTIWNYLVDIRMKRAKALLADPGIKIYEVARQVGYDNCEHFSKLFKEYSGLTPKEFRKAAEAGEDRDIIA